MFRLLIPLFCFIFAVLPLAAQYPLKEKQPDYYTFTSSPEQKITSDALELMPAEFRSHPEFAKIPHNAPCDNCTELLDRRKPDERYFVENGTNGKSFFVQKSYEPIHYIDESGNLLSIDPRLKETEPGIFSADKQFFPVKIDVTNRFASVKMPGHELKFNTALELLHKDIAGNITSLGTANWSRYTAGDDGVKVFDVWQGIDMEMRTFRGKVKTNFIVKEKFLFELGWLIIKDKLEYDNRLKPNVANDNSFFDSEINFSDAKGNEYYTISRALAFDDSRDRETSRQYLNYTFSENKELSIYIPLQWLNSDERVYPVTIDPLVSNSSSVPMATILGPRYGGFPYPGYANGCTYNLTTPVPANCTITNIMFSFGFSALTTCWMRDGGFTITRGACVSPSAGGIWTCSNPGTNPGTCTGIDYQILNQISSCVPPPQCASYNMDFVMTFYSCNALNGPNCSANTNCIIANMDWTMTIQGRTVEIPSITGTQTICVGNNATITAVGNYGVPPYSYSWSPGGMTGNSITVSPASNTTYTVTITDACSQTSTATSTVNVTQFTNPGFNITPNPACAGQPVTVNGLGVGPASSYDWTFPSSTTPVVNNNQNPNVTYNTSGTYNMTLNYAQGTCIFPVTQQVTISPNGGSPSVTVAANPSGAICAGTSVTFTATPVNGGSSPTYQWQVNGANAGSGGATFTTSSLNSGDIVTVIMTSNAPCVSPATATSTDIVMTVNPVVAPSVTIAANPAGPICNGTSVTFTATPVNGGGAPTYQWTVNGINSGTGATFTSNSLNNGDVIQVTMTSDANCVSPATATSNTITMTVNPAVTPSVSINANPPGPVCPGTSVTFAATPVNGGTSPTYQWQVNGINSGTGATFASTMLNNNDVVHVIMTSNANCAVPSTATSNTITMTILPAPSPSVSIVANPAGPVCAGTSITFTPTPVNGGTAPTYQWQVNGSNAGTGATFTSSSLNNNDVVTVVMTSNEVCVSPATATSNQITISISSNLVPSVSIAISPALPVCVGTSVTFTPSPVNGGSAPTYQWQVNGSNVATGATFTSNSLNHNDAVTAIMTSNATCVTTPTATSNTINMLVLPIVPPSVTITANPSGTVCSGTSVTFTATQTNGGVPVYQWQVNGSNAGSGGATFTTSSLNDGDNVSVIMTSNAACVSPNTATSNIITMTVTATVTPSVTVDAVPAGQICTGTSVTFTATPTNGGTNPIYQWTVNGSNSGTGATFTSSSLNNNDVVAVTMTSNDNCASPATASSTPITMNVSTVVVPSVTISPAPSNTICAGTNVTFTATPSGGGSAPTYQWTVNGANAGSNSPTFSSSSFNNSDVIQVIMTSSSSCANPQTGTSNSVTMTVNPVVTPSVTIADFPAGTQCAGTNITFTPTPVNGGPNPAYQWQINGVNAGTSDILSSNSFNDGDVVSVIMTADVVCATPASAASNSITVSIDQVITPSVTITSVPSGVVCSGVQVDFTATASSAGANPVIQWTVNGANVATGNTFSSSTLNNGDEVAVVLTSSSPCANPTTATASLTMTVNTMVTPAVSIIASPSGPVCSGANVTFTASPTNPGTNPVYQWYVNGSNAGSGGTTFTTNTLSEGDVITVSLTSSEPCVTGNPAMSNTITVSIAQPLAVNAGNDTVVCSGNAITLSAQATGGDGIYAYTWNNGAGNGSSVNVNPAQTTIYTVTVSDQCGSTPASDDVTVSVDQPIAHFTFTPEEANINNPEIRFENFSQGGNSYFWDFGDNNTSTDENPVHTYSVPGTYHVTLTVTSPGGCEETVSYTVIIKDMLSFWVPNAFTPNGDGLNDTFSMKGTFDKPYVMRIFNRLGSEIYFTDNSEPWNGAIFNSGEVVQNGVYVYEIDLDDSDYKGKPITGRVTVIRDGR